MLKSRGAEAGISYHQQCRDHRCGACCYDNIDLYISRLNGSGWQGMITGNLRQSVFPKFGGDHMNVEKARKTDIDSLVELRIRYLQEDFGGLSSGDIDAVRNNLPDYFESHLGKDLFIYMIRSGEEVVSCAFLLVVIKPMSPAFINGKTGTLLNVYTYPEFRHRGFAGEILKTIIADAKEMELCTIDIKSTDTGYSLYRSVGFHDDVSHYHFMKWENR